MAQTSVEAVSNVVTAAAYFALAGLLLALGLRPRLPFRLLILLFAAFIASCGITHLAHLFPWTSAWALPWTAAISVTAAVVTAALWRQVWRLPEQIMLLHRSGQIQLALAVEATQLGVWEYDVETRRLHGSDSMRRILGLPADGPLDRTTIGALVHPEDRARREAAMAEAVAKGDGAEYRTEYRILRPDGAVRWVEARGRVCIAPRKGAGSSLRLTGTLLDITERRETLHDLQRFSHELERRVAERTAEVRAADARLLESEHRFRSAFRDSAIGMALVGLDGEFLQVNRALCEILGYPEAALVARTFQDLTYPDDLAADLELVGQLLSGAIPSYNLEKRYVRADGSATWALLTVSLIRDAAGQPLYFVSQIQDIDARIRADAERGRTQEELRRAKEAAEAANRAKSAFLARMSHELRTPLNSIIGFSDLMLSGAGEIQPDLLEPIVRNGRHLLGLIEDILDLSKIEAGRSDLEIGPVDLGRLAEQLVRDFQPQLHGRQVRLKLEPLTWGQPQPIQADAVRLRQVLLNLVSNAVKFTPQGTVTLRILADDRTGQVSAVEVEDSGIGIPADRIEAIFDAFEQGQSYTSRVYGGTGLGLTISRRLCQQMGFTLSVTSTPGVGSTFRITMPAVDGAAVAAA